jgi:hypothetical protein
MSGHTSGRRLALCLACLLVTAAAASAQESVTVGLPASVLFNVGTQSTVTGNPAPTSVTFSNVTVAPGRVLRISVMANASAFGGSQGSSYPASAVSWTTTNASGGIGTNGTLSSSSYTQVFQSYELTPSGGFDLTWTLDPSSGTPRAGNQTLSLRWKIESVQP